MNNSGGGGGGEVGSGSHHAPDCTTAACSERCPLRLLLAKVEAQCPQVTELMVAQGRDAVMKMANYLACGVVNKDDPSKTATQPLPQRPPPKPRPPQRNWQRPPQKRGFF